MRSSFIYRWSRRTGWILIDLSRKATTYIANLPKLPAPNIPLILKRPISPIPGTRRATHKHRSRRTPLNTFESCLSESAAIAISIGCDSENKAILAHSINMALCKDSFTGQMRGFNYDGYPVSWEDYLARTSHVWSPEFSALLRRKGRRMARGGNSEWYAANCYRKWTAIVVRNLLEFFEDGDVVRAGDRLEGFEPLSQVEPRDDGRRGVDGLSMNQLGG